MGSSPRFVLGRILPFTDTSGSESIHRIGRVVLSLEPTAVTENRTNVPRAHSAPYACYFLWVRRIFAYAGGANLPSGIAEKARQPSLGLRAV